VDGWIKKYYQTLEWEHYTDIYTYKLFDHLMLKANIKDRVQYGFLIPRGSLIIREKTIGDECGLSYQEVRTSIKKLLRSGEITKKSTNKFTVVTIVNYGVYQSGEKESNDELTNNQRPINELSTSLLRRKKEGKKEINKDKELSSAQPPSAQPKTVKVFESETTEYKCAKYLADKILERNPSAKVPTDDTGLNKWAVHIDYMLRLDKRPIEELRKVVEYAVTDSFWSGNILSTAKLREKYDTLFMQMQNRKDGKAAAKPVKKTRFHNFENHKKDYGEIERLEHEYLMHKLKEGGAADD